MVLCASTFTLGLMLRMVSRALSTFRRPTSSEPCSTCLCRFEWSTTSKSTIPSVPTPAAR